jgi:uncharacterized protein with von Willebrand factor type A (vWA) domain
VRIRYSRWDGTQTLDALDAEELLSAMSDDLLTDGDLGRALRRLFQRGTQRPDGRPVPGLQDLLQRLRRQRQQRLDRYDLGSALDEIAQKLDDVIRTEREGVERRVADPGQREQKLQALDRLPPDPAGRIRELQRHEFTEPEAKRKFDELLKSLQQQMLKPFAQGMQQALQNMTPEDLRRMREMLRDLNRMLRQRLEGEEPDFQAFMDKWGENFPGVESLDELLERLAQQAGQMQSLMRSLSPEQRGRLDAMMRSLLLQDERLEAEMRQLGQNLGELMGEPLGRRYDFRGDEALGMDEAMRLMDELGQMDQLERELRGVEGAGDLERLDAERVGQLLGEESRRDLERLRELTRKLEEAGYLERRGERLSLTARAIRKIGDKALGDIFALLKRDRLLLDLRETLMNAVERSGPGTPVALAPGDFEVYRTELSTRASTVVMLDMSRSMLNNGYFLPAKKVALALTALIRGQFPRDTLHIVGFSLYAREFTAEQLPTLSWTEWNVGTNMHHGFQIARQLLGRQHGGNKQILMVTDGEPTAHMEDGEAEFSYPPTRRTLEETLKEVRRCTREGITINTFMLERSPMLAAFVDQMARINRGRAFFTAPERLGEYVLVDYVAAKRRAIS